MIIWKGLGIFVPVIVFVGVFLTHWIASTIWGNSILDTHENTLVAIGMIVAALLCFIVNKLLDKQPSKTYIDKETGEQVIFKKSHSLFFIPFKYWAYILPIIGIILFFT